MINWFLRLFGKAPIPTHAEIMAPLQKHLNALEEANEARMVAAGKAQDAIKVLEESIEAHHKECAANSITIVKLQEIL